MFYKTLRVIFAANIYTHINCMKKCLNRLILDINFITQELEGEGNTAEVHDAIKEVFENLDLSSKGMN